MAPRNTPILEVYRSKDKEFRWRLRSHNGKIQCNSGEGFGKRGGALRAARSALKALRGRVVIRKLANGEDRHSYISKQDEMVA